MNNLILNTIEDALPTGYILIYLTQFGSKLYGTDTPESDTDYKGIFIPSRKDILLKKDLEHIEVGPKDNTRKNTSTDIDCELWSIHKFFNLLYKGETGAMDMLFSMFAKNTIVYECILSHIIRDKSDIFLSKNIKAFTGYCMGQAQRYGIKGSRFGDLIVIKDLIDSYKATEFTPDNATFGAFVNKCKAELDNHKYVKLITIKDEEYLNVLGKNYQLSAPFHIVHRSIEMQYNSYGERSKLANQADGVDWKALSHAVRVIYQVEQLLQTQRIQFPLVNADCIRDVKLGKHTKEDVLQSLEVKMETVSNLVSKSRLPENPNKDEIDSLLLSIL